jgi:hypothetical protein
MYEYTITVLSITGRLGVKMSGGSYFLSIIIPGTYTMRFSSGTQTTHYLERYVGYSVNAVVDNVSVKKISPATGQIEYTGTPLFNPADTSADGDIITVNETDSLLVHTSDGEFEVSDGTNVSTVDPDYVKDTEYTVTIPYNATQMKIKADGDASATGTFAGTFSPGDFLGIGGSAAPMAHKSIKIKKTGDLS